MLRSTPLAFLASLVLSAGAAHAANVYVTSTGDDTLNGLYATRLAALGHTVTIGPEWHLYNGADLSAYTCVLLPMNFNWSRPAMSDIGQASIFNYVLRGGGLVTTEWAIWSSSGGTSGPFATLFEVFPTASSFGAFRSDTTITHTRNVANAVMDAGLPTAFTFTADNFAGTESLAIAKPGATVFYRTDYPGQPNAGGVVGWDIGNGRVLNFSTCVGTNQLNDANFSRLLSNAIQWAATSPGCTADVDDGSGSGIRDGSIAIEDLLYYLQLFADGVLRADVDDGSGTGTGDGGVSIEDLLYFLQRFASGC